MIDYKCVPPECFCSVVIQIGREQPTRSRTGRDGREGRSSRHCSSSYSLQSGGSIQALREALGHMQRVKLEEQLKLMELEEIWKQQLEEEEIETHYRTFDDQAWEATRAQKALTSRLSGAGKLRQWEGNMKRQNSSACLQSSSQPTSFQSAPTDASYQHAILQPTPPPLPSHPKSPPPLPSHVRPQQHQAQLPVRLTTGPTYSRVFSCALLYLASRLHGHLPAGSHHCGRPPEGSCHLCTVVVLQRGPTPSVVILQRGPAASVVFVQRGPAASVVILQRGAAATSVVVL